jgi:hypothetical protein
MHSSGWFFHNGFQMGCLPILTHKIYTGSSASKTGSRYLKKPGAIPGFLVHLGRAFFMPIKTFSHSMDFSRG